jgi:hypothetical protein
MVAAIIAVQLESTSKVFVRMHFLHRVEPAGGREDEVVCTTYLRQYRHVADGGSMSGGIIPSKIPVWTVGRKPGIDWASVLPQDSGKVWGPTNSFPQAE